MIDATFMKVHQHAANGVGTPESRGIGKTKGGKTTKLHAIVDEDGTLACFSLSPGNLNDCTAAPELLSQLSYKTILADKAYDTNALRELIAQAHCSACIPPKQNRKEPHPYDAELYKLRHVVENTFQRLKVFRSMDTRFQKKLEHVEGAVFFASTLLALNYRVASR